MIDPDLAWTVASYLAIRHGRPSVVQGDTIEVEDHEGMRFLLSRRGGGVAVMSSRIDMDGEVRSFVASRVRPEREAADLAGDIWDQVRPARLPLPSSDAPRVPATLRIMAALRDAAPDIRFAARRGRVGVARLDVDVIEADEPGLPVVAVGEHGAWVVSDDDAGTARDNDMVSRLVGDFIEAMDARRHAYAM